jgi:sugar lactone lactonase YvrE
MGAAGHSGVANMRKDTPRGAGILPPLSTILLLATFVILSGCAAKAPPHLPAEVKERLGTVGIASARFPPLVDFQTPAKGALAGAGRRATRWAGKVGGALSRGGCYGYGCLGVLGLTVVGTVGGALVGGVSGAVSALPAETVKGAEAVLARSLCEVNLPEELRDRVVKVARQRARLVVVAVPDQGPSSPDEPTNYASAAGQGIDSILEISVSSVGLAGEWDIDPPLRLAINGRTRLLRVRDGAEIHQMPLQYSSEPRRFTEWAENEAQPYREALDRALHDLAEQVAEEYLLLQPLELDSPSAVAVDAAGTIFVADTRHHQIERVDVTTHTLVPVAGIGEGGTAGDGSPATLAQLASPVGIAVDANGNLFIADQGSQRIRKVDAVSGLITTVAGTGDPRFAGDTGPATSVRLGSPGGLAIDATGNLFVADRGNHRIRKVDAATGVVTTIAGTGEHGLAGDGGPAKSAKFFYPASVAIDRSGNLFIADVGNHRVRRIEAATAVITTVVGTGEGGCAGDGGLATAAQLWSPAGIAVSATGDLFIADKGSHQIRRVDAATGLITTVAGTGESGFTGDGGPATSARLASPAGIAVDAAANLLIADQGNNRIREVDLTTGVITTIAGDGRRPGENAGERGPQTNALPAEQEGGLGEPRREP